MTDTIPVDPARLSWGNYDHEKGRQTGTGDIHSAYSAGEIMEGKPVRKPFKHDGSLWVTVSMSGCGGVEEAEAYRLVPAAMFTGTPTTYSAKTDLAEHAEAARHDPNGFYDRVSVKCGGADFVLVGPPAVFVAEIGPQRPEAKPELEAQLSLFEL